MSAPFSPRRAGAPQQDAGNLTVPGTSAVARTFRAG
jgi:hypothetical protein